MTESHSRRQPVMPPSLDELTARYLATGMATGSDPVRSGDVELHEVSSGGFRAPARAIWDEALLPLRLLGANPDKLSTPPEWAAYIGVELSIDGLPMAAGLIPQQFRLLPGHLSGTAASHPATGSPSAACGMPALRGWVRKAARSPSATTLLAASGIAAILGEHSDAESALAAAEPLCRGPWKVALDNQRAAVAWLAGRRDEAVRIWTELPDGPITGFNRGMAARISGRSAEAAALLQRASESLPDSSGWSHLAQVYLRLHKPS